MGHHGCRRRVGTLGEMLQRRQMGRLPALHLHLAVVCLLGICCLNHASRAAISFPPAAPMVQLQETDAILTSNGAEGQAVLGEPDRGGVRRRMEMEMELEDYPGSGANDHHSPWWQQERRN